MSTNDHYTVPSGDGQGPIAPPTTKKYTFEPSKCIILDFEVYPHRWCCGFLNPTTGRYFCVDGDRNQLAKVLDKIHRAGMVRITYNGDHYDEPLGRAILAGEEDFYEVSRSLVTWDDWDLPPELKDLCLGWPEIKGGHIDLAARTRDHGRIKSLKSVAANLGVRHLAELPYDPERSLSDEEWEEVKRYNERDLEDIKVLLDHFSPELDALSALSQKYGMDLRSTHPAGVASRVLCAAYRSQHGADPVRVEPPGHIRYRPPAAVRRPWSPIAAARFDRLVTEEFPLIVGKKSRFPKPVVPQLAAPIEIGGLKLNEGKGGLISQDKPAAHRADAEHEIVDVDVASFYPSMISEFGIAPKSLGSCGADLFKEILDTRLDLKEQAARATDPAIQKRLKAMSDGLKIVLNSVFGQFEQFHSKLYDPAAALAVTLTGQFLLLNLVERLAEAGVTLLAVHTDGVLFKARRDSSEAWHGVLSDWQTDTNLTLESTAVQLLVIEATNRYLIQYADGRTKRRGSGLGDQVDWRHVPNRRIVADAVVAALLHGKLPEDTIRACTDPFKFTSLTRRKKSQQSDLVDGRGSIQPLGQIIRWYWAKGEGAQIRIRGRDCNGKEFTRKAAEGVQLLPDLPDSPLGDIDYGRYIAEARERILACRDFPHLDPQWLADSPAAQDLYARGLSPAPKWDGKKSPKGSKVQFPSYFWPWDRYDAFGTHTGPEVRLLVLDSDKPAKFRGWVDDGLVPNTARHTSLDGCMVSYHRCDSPEAVRSGAARGKLIFRLEGHHHLARIKGALLGTIGCEVFYGHGTPTVLGVHPDGPEHDYLLSGVLGPPPDWLLNDLVGRALPKIPKPRAKKVPSGNGKPADSAAVAKYAKVALESEVAKVAAAPEGERNSTLWKASCALGSLAGAGAVDREVAEEKLIEATTLPPEEAVDVVRRGLDRGAEAPRDLTHVGTNGDGFERPIIEITVEEHAVNDVAIAALVHDPDLYQRGHLLVRVLRDGPRPDDMECGRDPGGLTIMPVHTSTLRERLTKYAHWVKRKRGEDGEWTLAPVHPPDWTVPAVMNRGSWEGVRFLEGVTEVPLFLPDGTVLETPGYDRRSGILYLPEILYPKVPDAPTREDAAAAANLLLDVVVDFPFKGPEHQSAWLAALLTPLARPAVAGCAPLFVFDANAAGTGKSMLCDIISLVGCGRQVGRTAYPTTEEEMNKSMLSIALGGARLVLFDNSATGAAIGGACLDAALTATTYSGRVLGISKFVADVPLAATFYVTGNNITLKGDTLRRVVLSRLETSEDHPEERDGFAVPDLIGSVRARRGELAVAALTILRAYIVAGRPAPDPRPKPMGGFEAWSELVRRATHWATGFDPCATKSEAKAADKTATQLPALIEGWARLCRSANADSLSTAQAIKVLESSPEDHATLYAVLTETTRDGRLPSPQGLGNLLGKVRGRPHAGRSLERTETYGVNQWFVKVSQPGTPTVQEPAALPAEDDLPF